MLSLLIFSCPTGILLIYSTIFQHYPLLKNLVWSVVQNFRSKVVQSLPEQHFVCGLTNFYLRFFYILTMNLGLDFVSDKLPLGHFSLLWGLHFWSCTAARVDPDGSPLILKNCASTVALPFFLLFRSLALHVFPNFKIGLRIILPWNSDIIGHRLNYWFTRTWRVFIRWLC
jgi:hypothetical protein